MRKGEREASAGLGHSVRVLFYFILFYSVTADRSAPSGQVKIGLKAIRASLGQSLHSHWLNTCENWVESKGFVGSDTTQSLAQHVRQFEANSSAGLVTSARGETDECVGRQKCVYWRVSGSLIAQ